eukprot:2367010-Amphidinium_carterae.1
MLGSVGKVWDGGLHVEFWVPARHPGMRFSGCPINRAAAHAVRKDPDAIEALVYVWVARPRPKQKYYGTVTILHKL